jgi:hypothetical protein
MHAIVPSWLRGQARQNGIHLIFDFAALFERHGIETLGAFDKPGHELD